MSRRTTPIAVLAVLMLTVPRVALACPICFGQSDSPLALGANMGIWVMLGVTGTVLAGFGGFILYLVRKAKMATPLVAAAESNPYNSRQVFLRRG